MLKRKIQKPQERKKKEEREKEMLLFDHKIIDFNLKNQKEIPRAQVACHKSPTKTLKRKKPKKKKEMVMKNSKPEDPDRRLYKNHKR